MRYRYLDDFRRGISVFAIFSYGIAVLGTPQCPPPLSVGNLSGFMPISVDGRPNRKNEVAFSNLSGIEWTGP